MIKWWIAGVAIAMGTSAVIILVNKMIEKQAKEWMQKIHAETPPEPMNVVDDYNGSLFDCPECNLPAEVATYVTMWDPDTGHAATYVVINCPADHDLITVTEDWFVDHVLSKNID